MLSVQDGLQIVGCAESVAVNPNARYRLEQLDCTLGAVASKKERGSAHPECKWRDAGLNSTVFRIAPAI